MLELVIILLVLGALVLAAWALCYGGWGGPIDWVMRTHTHGRRDKKQVALTFDDGPDPARTPALLDALAELDVKATFFLIGAGVDANPDIARRIAAEGHELGNHTYTHRYLPIARTRRVTTELAATDRAIKNATGVVPSIARPPWGGRAPWTVRAFAQLAKRLILWDVNSFDWKGKPAAEVAQRVMERARPGSIILMHDAREGGEVTVEAVKLLVPQLRAKGFELVTVSAAVA
jgi:peptidoglycan/xylan/chitin deacetylase (PgdA/CDA1 family)